MGLRRDKRTRLFIIVLLLTIILSIVYSNLSYALVSVTERNINNMFSTGTHFMFFYHLEPGIATQPENNTVKITKKTTHKSLVMDLGRIQRRTLTIVSTSVPDVLRISNKTNTTRSVTSKVIANTSPSNSSNTIVDIIAISSANPLSINQGNTGQLNISYNSFNKSIGVYTGWIELLDQSSSISFQIPIRVEIY